MHRYAIIIPVRNEAPCLGAVLDELRVELARLTEDGREFRISVGLNATTDESAKIALTRGALVGVTNETGYGHGCQAGLDAAGANVDAYVFMTGDGSNDPADLEVLLSYYEAGYPFVMGNRTPEMEYWRDHAFHAACNAVLGLAATLLSGHRFVDLGPFRVIDARLMRRMALRERVWGWTIEGQIVAARMGVNILQIPVRERPRLAGEQKVTGVSLRHSLRVGWEILQAGIRAARRPLNSVL